VKFSYQWIRELVDGLDVEAKALERLITTRTAECEGIEPAGELLAGASVARVESVEAIEGSKAVKAVVQTELYGRKTVVCGAPNCRPGIETVYAPIGIKRVQGIESDGMLASAEELGISKDHAGIVELGGNRIPEPDAIIEIDNKSLTHRPDLWGHYGMAREVAAITGSRLKPLKGEALPTGPAAVKVAIENLELCPRYSALVFSNVKVGPSPLWLQYRLTAIGLNPINNIVDLTNYIMAETAQPMHAFDRDLLRGDTIFVRNAREGESIAALNKETYDLGSSNLVIADAGGPIAVAGVIGGLDSAISEKTTNIVFESANFHAGSVRKTSSALKLRTDASMRFEKSQDPANTVRALSRAIELMREISPGARLEGGLADEGKPLVEPPVIPLKLGWLARKLGRPLPAEEVREILTRLEFGVVQDSPDTLQVRVPSWRATKDVAVPDDLVEEVGRMIGYDSIPPQAPAVLAVAPPDTPERTYLRRLRAAAAAQGFTEVHNYSFISEEQAERFGFDAAEHIKVLNPIAANQGLMRRSLVPGICANVVENSKHFSSFRIFEIGREIHKQAVGLPDEVFHLVAAISGDIFELVRLAECLAVDVRVKPAEARKFEHPRRTADVYCGEQRVGRLAEFHPNWSEHRAAFLDLDLRLLAAHERRPAKYTPIRRFPSTSFDLSVLAEKRELVGVLQQKMADLAGALAERIEYAGQYEKSDRKSVTFHFVLSSPDRTLSSDEAGAVRQNVIDGMRRQGYELTL
jgi:phenylalanyl-tRNA synthetase beta chain